MQRCCNAAVLRCCRSVSNLGCQWCCIAVVVLADRSVALTCGPDGPECSGVGGPSGPECAPCASVGERELKNRHSYMLGTSQGETPMGGARWNARGRRQRIDVFCLEDSVKDRRGSVKCGPARWPAGCVQCQLSQLARDLDLGSQAADAGQAGQTAGGDASTV